jgi:diadenylate cyclase
MDLSFLSGVIASPWDIIRTLLDIAIVAYVFYRILRVISGTSWAEAAVFWTY